MYCRNCGKKIEQGMLCQDCLTLLEQAKKEETSLNEQTITSVDEAPVSNVVSQNSSASVKNATENGEAEKPTSKKMGVFAVVLSIVGMFCQFVLYVSMVDSFVVSSYVGLTEIIATWLKILFLSTPTVLGLIFGILSITAFFKNKKNGKKTWANLVLGAIAVEFSSIAIFFLCLNLIVALTFCEFLFIY